MPVDVVTLVLAAVVSALIQGVVGTLIWLAVRRNVEMVDRLQERLNDFEAKRLGAVENSVKILAETEGEGRRRIHEEITWVRTHFVHSNTCAKMMGEVARGMENFASATHDLARIQAATEMNTREIGRVTERIAGVAEDQARMEGRHEGNAGGTPVARGQR